jgi:formyltetrahydrofolate deformylase
VARATFLVAAPDQPGLVARLAGFFYSLGLNILDSGNHSDVDVSSSPPRFFMRIVVDLGTLASPKAQEGLGGSATRAAMETAFGKLVESLEGTWSVGYSDQVAKIAILVTKDPTCLYDLVLRQRAGELPCEIALVISNHDLLESVAASFRIPYFALPVDRERKRDQEQQVLGLVRRFHVDLVVLARYMQILSPAFVARWPGRIINIHHSFLPAFVGARPYHQAKERGVKLIGATAHYVTTELDQGPIIEQDVCRVSHRDDVDDLVRKGRDLERQVLTRAVRLHLQRRVLIFGNRTIVFG